MSWAYLAPFSLCFIKISGTDLIWGSSAAACRAWHWMKVATLGDSRLVGMHVIGYVHRMVTCNCWVL